MTVNRVESDREVSGGVKEQDNIKVEALHWPLCCTLGDTVVLTYLLQHSILRNTFKNLFFHSEELK